MIKRNSSEHGRKGEEIVADHLRKRGASILERNWRWGRYETDIVALERGVLLFVEVKTRSIDGWTAPEDAVTESKLRYLRRSARAYMSSRRVAAWDIRIDVAAVDLYPDGSHRMRYIEDVDADHW